jgi:uncharacterized protein YutE (UPF0331/DUF86 family)
VESLIKLAASYCNSFKDFEFSYRENSKSLKEKKIILEGKEDYP